MTMPKLNIRCSLILSTLLFMEANAEPIDTPEPIPVCETKGKTISDLNLAIELIKTATDSYPVCSTAALPLDCADVLRGGENTSGIFNVWPRSRVSTGPVEVYCDMDRQGGGWTVIQRRGNYLRLKDFFYQDWESYKKGFGNVDKDFWLGNDNIFALSNQKLYSVLFDLQDIEGSWKYAMYDAFWIDDEDHQYTLHIKGYSGDAGDSMIGSHDGKKFSTKDKENDESPETNCAQVYKGGWWYGSCHSSNLNGLYHGGKHESYADGINWHAWKGHHESLVATEIKIRPKNFRR